MAEAVDQRTFYLQKCRELGITPNSLLVKTLPTSGDRAPSVDSYDFHRNYLGDRGVIALIETLKLNPHFTSLNLSDNGIRNAGAVALASVLKHHPRLAELDVSNNQISQEGGEALLALVRACPNLRTLRFNGNRIEAALRLRIKAALEDNLKGGRP